jgi:hypothetical protein
MLRKKSYGVVTVAWDNAPNLPRLLAGLWVRSFVTEMFD